MDRLVSALDALEASMKQKDLWEAEMPSAEAMASTAPFSCDTMGFNQWLQFIFLPKIRQMIEQGEPLPGKCELASMGIHFVGQKGLKDVMPFLKSLKQIDNCFEQNLH